MRRVFFLLILAAGIGGCSKSSELTNCLPDCATPTASTDGAVTQRQAPGTQTQAPPTYTPGPTTTPSSAPTTKPAVTRVPGTDCGPQSTNSGCQLGSEDDSANNGAG